MHTTHGAAAPLPPMPLVGPGEQRPSGSLPARPRVGVIGTGRVGAALGAALLRGGNDVVAVHARSAASRTRAAALLPGVPCLEPEQVAAASDVLLLTVPDPEIAPLVHLLAARAAFRPGTVVVHTSGRHGLGVLEPAAAAGAAALAVHPAMTFQGTPTDVDRIAGTHFGVTALGRHWDLAERLVAALGGHPVSVPEQLRPLWHAGLAHGANHLVTLVSSALEVIAATGASDPAAVLRPLLTAALDGALERGMDALTGPVARGDAATVETHLAALDEVTPGEQPLYLTLSRATAERVQQPSPAVLDVLGLLRSDQRTV